MLLTYSAETKPGFWTTPQRHVTSFPATNHPAVSTQPIKLHTTLPPLNCGHRSYEQLVLSPLVRISPVLVNCQCIMCVCVCVHVHTCARTLSHVQLFVTPWTVACQAPLSMKFSRQEYWNGLPLPSPGKESIPGSGTKPKSPAHISCIGSWILTHCATWEVQLNISHRQNETSICSNRDGPREYHTKWSKSEKDKYHMTSLICGI